MSSGLVHPCKVDWSISRFKGERFIGSSLFFLSRNSCKQIV